MTVSRGKVHKYLGMTLDYTVSGQVKITMSGYIDEILSAFDKADLKGCGTKSSAASKNLFKINEDCEKLQPKKAVEFHNLVAKTLYATKRARPDTCTGHRVPYDKSESARQGRLEETQPSHEIPQQRHAVDAPDTECQR